METLSRLNYSKTPLTDAEFDEGVHISQTLNEGLNDGGVLAFRIPADPHRFTDLSSAILSVNYRIQKGNEEAMLTDMVVLEPGGMHSFFKSCDVRFNGVLVSSMTSYAHSAAICRYLGTSQLVREGVYDEMDGSWPIQYFKRTDITGIDEVVFTKPLNTAVGTQQVIGRVFSDVLSSCRQLLPPGVSIDIDLRRAPDHFSLCSNKEQASTFNVNISAATLMFRRLRLRPQIHSRVMDSIREGATLQFNQLDCRVASLSSGLKVWRWLDCLNGAPLPNRIYVAMVSQSAYYGNINECGTYMYHNLLSSFGAQLNGHDVFLRAVQCDFEVEEDGDTNVDMSNAKQAFLALAEVTGQLADPTSTLRLSYKDFVCGNTVFAVELGKSGEKAGAGGTLDLAMSFKEGVPKNTSVLLFTEKTQDFTLLPKAA